MTLYGFGNPRTAIIDALKASSALLPTDTTVSTKFPTSSIAAPQIQVAWDGTPSEDQVRENATIRLTVWTPSGQESSGITLASLVRAIVLNYASDSVWRTRPGAGRTPGIDPDTGLPFVTFTVIAESRPHVVA